MAAPENLRRGIFPIIAPTRERTATPVREKELAPPPTPAEARAANAGEYAGETRTVEKVGGNKLLKAVLGGGAVVAAGAIAYEAVPAVHRAVDFAFLNHLRGKSLSSEASTQVFDPQADKQTVKAGVNAVSITPEELLSILQNAIVSGNEVKPPKVSILTPAKLEEGETLDYSNHIVPLKPIDKNGVEHPIDVFLGVDYILPNRKTDIPLFVDRAEIFQLPPLIDKGKSYLTGLVLKKTMPDGNPLFFIVESPDDIRNLEPEESIKDAPIVTEFRKEASANTPFINDAREGIVVSVNRDMVPVILRAKPNTHLLIRVIGYKTGLSNLPISLITIANDNASKAIFSPQN